jgi:hypothetical protein
MPNLTPEGLRILTDVATRHGVSLDVALTLLGALAQRNGRQAQFNHPELGGMGQWSQGGMIMIGDMFNQGLKNRVDALCHELTDFLRSQPLAGVEAAHFQSQSQSGGEEVSLYVAATESATGWWPEELGSATSTGAQNDMRYACFPGRRRLAIQQGGRVCVYDTGEHTISGFSQQQGGDQSLTFTSQFGLVRVADLALISPPSDRSQNRSSPASATPSHMPGCAPPLVVGAARAPPASLATEDIVKTIERLAELRQKNILTEEEFAVKKAELLSRL